MRLAALQLLGFILFADACWALGSIAATGEPYPVTHSEYAAEDRAVTYRLSWLDNDRVLFVGEPKAEVLARFGEDRRIKSGAKLPKPRFYIWDTRANKVVTYKELSEPVRFCYNEVEDWIRYQVPGKQGAVMQGRFGAEREIAVDPRGQTIEGRNKRGVFFDELTCREHAYAPREVVPAGRVSPLLANDGILDVWRQRPDDARPVRLFSSDFRQIKELNLPRRAIDPYRTYFSRYKNAYILYGSTAPPHFENVHGGWPDGIGQPVYALSPDGQLALAGEIPWRRGFRESLQVYITTRGLVYATGRPRSNPGLFLVTDGKVTKLLSFLSVGSIDAGAESPNGCRIAAAFSMDAANKAGGLKVIDFCTRAAE